MADTPPPADPGRESPHPAEPPPDAPTESIAGTPDDATSRMHAGPPLSGARYPGPPAGEWPPPATGGQGRVRQLGRRLRGSRLAVAVLAILVAAVLVAGGVAGGVAIGEGGHDGGGRGGRESVQRDGNDVRGMRGERGGGQADGQGGRGDSGRGDGRGERGPGIAANDNGGNGANSEQQVLGTITAISSTSITVRTSGGNPSYPITANTPVTRGGSAASVTDLKAGDAVVIRVVTSSAGAAPVVARISAG